MREWVLGVLVIQTIILSDIWVWQNSRPLETPGICAERIIKVPLLWCLVGELGNYYKISEGPEDLVSRSSMCL